MEPLSFNRSGLDDLLLLLDAGDAHPLAILSLLDEALAEEPGHGFVHLHVGLHDLLVIDHLLLQLLICSQLCFGLLLQHLGIGFVLLDLAHASASLGRHLHQVVRVALGDYVDERCG